MANVRVPWVLFYYIRHKWWTRGHCALKIILYARVNYMCVCVCVYILDTNSLAGSSTQVLGGSGFLTQHYGRTERKHNLELESPPRVRNAHIKHGADRKLGQANI